MNEQSPQNQDTIQPPNVPQNYSEHTEKSKYGILIPVFAIAFTVLLILIVVLLWLRITTPQTEQKGVLPVSVEEKQKEISSSFPITCGNPEPLDVGSATFFRAVPNIVVNEWYVDPSNPAESFIELRNASNTTVSTDGIGIVLYPLNVEDTYNGGIVPTIELGSNCLVVIRQKDIIPKKAGNKGYEQLYTNPAIVSTYLWLESRATGSNVGQIEYIKNMPAGFSVSLTSAGKYIASAKTPGAFNGAILKSAFSPSVAAVKYFKDIVPYIPSANPDERIIAKWTLKEVPLYIGGNATEADRICISKAAQSLRELTGLVIPEKNLKPTDNIKHGLKNSLTILFIPPTDSDLSEVSQHKSLGFARAIWHGGEFTNHINYGEVYLSPSYSPQEKCSLVYWGLGKAIGIMRKGTGHPASIFNDVRPSMQSFGEIDQEIIRMLYDPLVEPGDTTKDINRLYPS